MRINVFPTPAAVATVAAEIVAARARAAVKDRGRFVLGLTGGRSAQAMYRLLAEAGWHGQLPWTHTHVVWSDERCVPAQSPENNALLADTLLLDHVPVPAAQVHRVVTRWPADEAARQYEAVLRRDVFPAGEPRVDVLLLGLGDDAHVASLFPGSPALAEQARWVVGARGPDGGPDRVTLTLPVINAAATILLQVCGQQKGHVLRRVLAPNSAGEDLPARRIAPRDGELIWLVDDEAQAAIDRA